MVDAKQDFSRRLLYLYYAGTAVFMLLDYVFDFNVRLTFLDDQPLWRLAWYMFCYACLGLMLWRPEWADYVGLVESLLTMSLIIIGTATRVMIVTDEMIETGHGFVSMREILNFVITFTVIYVGYIRHVSVLRGR